MNRGMAITRMAKITKKTGPNKYPKAMLNIIPNIKGII